MPVTAEELTRFKAHRWQISCLEFNDDGSRLASGGWDKEVHIWDLGSLEVVHTLRGTRAPVTCLCWYRPNSGILCTGSADQTASLWNSETGSRVATLKEHFGWVLGSCFSTSGSHLATASWDKTVRIWDAGTATLINNLSGHTAGVWSVDFHPRSSMLCSAGQDGSVIIWDARSNRPVRNMSYGHTDAVYSAKWSPDGAMIASGSADTKICIWETGKGSVINTIYGHTDTVKTVAFNPYSENIPLPILASAGDFSLRLSDPRPTQKADILSCSLHTPGKEVEAVSISPDGSLLVTGGRDGLLILMNLHIPSVVPHTGTKATTSATVRHSCEVLEESLKLQSASDPPKDIFRTEEELRVANEAREVLMDIHDEHKRRSRQDILETQRRKSDLDAGRVNLRRSHESHERRIKEKVVDIPTMIAHLSARASFIEELSSSSGESSSDTDNDSDSEDIRKEGQFQVNFSKTNDTFLNRKDTVQEIMESNGHPPPLPQLPLLPDEAEGTFKEHINVFERKERDNSIFDGDDMDNVVLLMKNFLDDNKPEEVGTKEQSHPETRQDYYPPVAGLIPGEREGDFMTNDRYNLEPLPGQFSFSPRHANSGVGFKLNPEQLPSVPPVHPSDNFSTHIPSDRRESLDGRRLVTVDPSVKNTEDGKRHPFDRIGSASGSEYGDEVPLSMI